MISSAFDRLSSAIGQDSRHPGKPNVRRIHFPGNLALGVGEREGPAERLDVGRAIALRLRPLDHRVLLGHGRAEELAVRGGRGRPSQNHQQARRAGREVSRVRHDDPHTMSIEEKASPS
jgi:hypothetical protein